MSKTAYSFTADDIGGHSVELQDYSGKVMLVVNTASKCGFTPQYAGLQTLHQELAGDGLQILGFPCNQFGGQEPGDESEVAEFCQLNYGVDFPMFAKVEVNGEQAHPLFKWLKEAAPGLLGSKKIKWNFTKFLIDKHGKPVKRYAPTTKPEELRDDIVELLALQ